MSDAMDINEIAKPEGPDGETFDFADVGDMVTGKVVHFDTFSAVSKFGKNQRTLVITLEQPDGSNLKVWPKTNVDLDGDGYPDRMAKAIVAAIKASGQTQLKVGATLAVKFDGLKPTDKGNPARLFVAEYVPAAAAAVADDLSEDGAVSGLIAS